MIRLVALDQLQPLDIAILGIRSFASDKTFDHNNGDPVRHDSDPIAVQPAWEAMLVTSDENDHGSAVDTPTKVKGEVKEVLGAVTGDRHVEAEGRVEQRVADPGAPEREPSEEAVRRDDRAVRQAHHDVPGEVADPDGPLGT